MTTKYQKDFRITIPEGLNKKATLDLSPTGDIQLHEGSKKLTAQILRAIVNENSIGRQLLNIKTVKPRHIKTLLTVILRNFKQTQINEIEFYDPDVSGFSVWRRAAGTDEQFSRVSDKAQTWKYTDTGLFNGTEYEYGISKIYRDTYETNFVENINVTPSTFASRQDFIIGDSTIFIPGNKQVTMFFDYSRAFRGSELLNTVENIRSYAAEDDPRNLIVEIVGTDFNGNETTLTNSFVVIG